MPISIPQLSGEEKIKLTRRAVAFGGVGMLTTAAMSSRAGDYRPFQNTEEHLVIRDAYLFGYPLVAMEMLRRVNTNVTELNCSRTPMRHLIKSRNYLDDTNNDVAGRNADMLISSAFLDVGDEPWVLSVPNMNDRYLLLSLFNGWTEGFGTIRSRADADAD